MAFKRVPDGDNIVSTVWYQGEADRYTIYLPGTLIAMQGLQKASKNRTGSM